MGPRIIRVMTDLVLTVSDFVAVFNQTIEYAYPSVVVTGELANFRISKNRWVYFDLKDEAAIVRFFGTVYQLPGPLEDGMLLQVKGTPRLHPQYGFSVTVQHIQPTGEGSIKKAALLLQTKLTREGLFDVERKRPLPYPPLSIGLVTSAESAAFRDFIKVINARWGGMTITLADVQVQGEAASQQIIEALNRFNQEVVPPDVVVLTRGGGSAEDLQVFNTEQVTRAVAASRIPTLVAIGHEIDVSLAELAADRRASTPSNAAELLVPDRKQVRDLMREQRRRLLQLTASLLDRERQHLLRQHETIGMIMVQQIAQAKRQLALRRQLIQAFNPQAALERGYALIRKGDMIVRSGRLIAAGDALSLQLVDANIVVEAKRITMRNVHGKKTS
jgi:exodeoxyribonuclease VII large subunit